METIKSGRIVLLAVVWLRAKVRDRLYAGSVCDNSAAEAAYAETVALYE